MGLSDFSDEAVKDPAVVALAQKVRYRIDPNNSYPYNFTGHIRATLRDGSVIEERQPHMRGGAHEPLSRGDIEGKFLLNARHGGYDAARAQMALKLAIERGRRTDRSVHAEGINQMPDKELAGRVAVITGAGRSIGRAMALELASAGAAVVVNVRSNRAEADAVVKEIESKGGKAMVAIADAGRRARRQRHGRGRVEEVRPHRLPHQQRRAARGEGHRAHDLRGNGGTSSASPSTARSIA